MSEDKNGWPGEPGVPLHPERDGWHWLQFEGAPKPFPWCWLPATETDPVAAWGSGDGRELTTAGAAKRWRYLGPCLTPADLAAERAAAAEAMREAAADCARLLLLPDDCGPAEAHGRFQQAIATCEAIRALPIPSASALAERDERMREEGSREAFVKTAEHLRRVALSYDRNGANQAAGSALRGEAEFIEMLAAETRARSEGKG